jgi:hypothetical protein
MEDQSRKIERMKSLNRMRSKLVNAETRPAGRPGLTMPDDGSRGRRFLMIGALAALALVTAANVYSFLERDDILAKVEPLPPKLEAFEPPKHWKVDEKAMFWAYAAYNPAKFEARFGPIPEGKMLDRKKAAQKARAIFEAGGLNAIVESDVKALLEANKRKSPANSI